MNFIIWSGFDKPIYLWITRKGEIKNDLRNEFISRWRFSQTILSSRQDFDSIFEWVDNFAAFGAGLQIRRKHSMRRIVKP